MKIIIILFLLVTASLALSDIARSQDEFEMKDGDETFIMKKYYMCFLKRGDNRTQDSAASALIQKGHMEHLSKLYKEGHIQIAGPFGGDGEIRGIVVFSVKSKEEAERLASEDPAVIAGRLKVEIHEWWAAKGSTLK